MKRVYLDNGSTSYPKAPGVGQAVFDFIENIGTNVNRGGYEAAYGVLLRLHPHRRCADDPLQPEQSVSSLPG